MEGDSQVRGGGGELEGAAATDVPPQDPCRDLIAVSDGQHVTVTDVQSEDSERERSVASGISSSYDDSESSRVDSRLCGRRDTLKS